MPVHVSIVRCHHFVKELLHAKNLIVEYLKINDIAENTMAEADYA